MRHLCRSYDIRLSIKGRVYNPTGRTVLLYGHQTRLVSYEYSERLVAFHTSVSEALPESRWNIG